MRNRDILLQILQVFLAALVCTLLMLVVFCLLHRLDRSVVMGALVGLLLATGNFFFLSLGVVKAADRAVEGGEKAAAKAKLSMQRSSTLRLLILLVLYILLLKSGYFHVLASVLPLAFMQLGIYVTEFFRKDGVRSQ